MDNTSDKTQSSNDGAPLTEGTRRRFTRNAIAGSAVLLSLGNRAAWAEVPVEQCLSAATWDSLSSDFASLSPANEGKLLEIQMRGIDEDHSLYPDYICPKDPNAVDTDETKMGNQMDWMRKPKPDADFGSKKWSNQLDRLSDPD